MEVKTMIPIFSYALDVFQKTMKELFVNEFSCEETSLHFIVADGLKCIGYMDDQWKPEEFETDGKKRDDAVKQFLNDKFPDRMYMMRESDFIFSKEQKIKIYWVFLSESLDKNTGRFLLRCVIEELAEYFDSCLRDFPVVNENMMKGVPSENSGQLHYLIQDILHEAEVRADSYLEMLLAPLNFQFIAGLSGEYYEKAECQSDMIFLFAESVKEITESIFVYRFYDIEFDGEKIDEIEFLPSKIRLIRKLLQMAQKGLCLVLAEDKDKKVFKVLGIARECDFSGYKFPKVIVKFKKHMQWELLINDTYIFTYKNGQNKIEQEISESYLKRTLCDCFGEHKAAYKNLICSIIDSTKQEHGTMLVVMNAEDAREEVKRLGYRRYGFPENKPGSYKGQINQLNSIDGSVFMDTSGNIHGIGMILDGISDQKGDPARGARYNSALKYKEYLKKRDIRALLVIVSEDGSVDILRSPDEF